MIEDHSVVEDINGTLGVDGVHGVFVGWGDLTVAMNDRSGGSRFVEVATEKVIRAAGAAGKPVLFVRKFGARG